MRQMDELEDLLSAVALEHDEALPASASSLPGDVCTSRFSIEAMA
jgi:hypothetical protein